MPRRLVTAAFLSAVAFALSGGTARADGASALGQVESPARFVLPKVRHLTVGQRVAKLARRQLGVPYVWGGASPSGFDCSGLVSYVYGKVGIGLPHNSAALYGVGRPVPRGALRPGDLLFFSGLGHIGLYIGNGRMIHAPQSGRRVEVQPLSMRRGSLVGARRVTTR